MTLLERLGWHNALACRAWAPNGNEYSIEDLGGRWIVTRRLAGTGSWQPELNGEFGCGYETLDDAKAAVQAAVDAK